VSAPVPGQHAGLVLLAGLPQQRRGPTLTGAPRGPASALLRWGCVSSGRDHAQRSLFSDAGQAP